MNNNASPSAASEVRPDGTYSIDRTLTGIMAGGFGVTATVRWTDVCNPQVAVGPDTRPTPTASPSDQGSARDKLEEGRNLLAHFNFYAALAPLSEALKSYKSGGDMNGIGVTSDALGDLYLQEGQYEVALGYFQSARQAFVANKETVNASLMISKIGETYLLLDNIAEAKAVFAQFGPQASPALSQQTWFDTKHSLPIQETNSEKVELIICWANTRLLKQTSKSCWLLHPRQLRELRKPRASVSQQPPTWATYYSAKEILPPRAFAITKQFNSPVAIVELIWSGPQKPVWVKLFGPCLSALRQRDCEHPRSRPIARGPCLRVKHKKALQSYKLTHKLLIATPWRASKRSLKEVSVAMKHARLFSQPPARFLRKLRR